MKNYVLTALFLCAGLAVSAQKKALALEDFNSWNSIGIKAVTDDGAFVFYSISPQEGDGVFYVYDVQNDTTLAFNRAERPQITSDNKFLIFKVALPYAEERELKRKKTKKADMPKDKLVIYEMATGKTDTIKEIAGFSLPSEEGNWLAVTFEKEPKDEAKEKAEADKKAEEAKGKKKKTKKVKKPKKAKKGEVAEAKPVEKKKKPAKPTGKFVRLINLETGENQDIKYVDDSYFPEYATQFYFLREIGDSVNYKGLFALDLASKNTTLVDSAFKGCTNISMNKRGTTLMYMTTADSAKAEVKKYSLNMWNGQEKVMMLDTATAGMKAGWMPSPDFKTVVDENGKYLLVGTKPIPTIFPKDTMALDEEKVKLDIWSWMDEEIQPMQNLNKNREAKRSYIGRIDLSDNSFLQLGEEDFEMTNYSRDTVANYFAAEVDKPWRKEASWLIPTYRDVYIVEVATGKRTLVKEKVRDNLSFSPNQKYAYWFDRNQGHWFAFEVATGKTVNLSKSVKYPVYDEEYDTPDTPTEYDQIGWIGDSLFVFTDRFDIWAVNPAKPAKPRYLTKGEGRKNNVRYAVDRSGFAYVNNLESVLQKDNWLLTSFNETNKNEGFINLNWQTGEMSTLVAPEAYSYNTVRAAKDADVLIYQKGNFTEYPELYVTDGIFESPKKLTNTNPQQAEFNWGTVELFTWKSAVGKEMQGLLYKPEDFDASKKYPVLVYFYETYSDGLNSYRTPAPSASTINFTQCVSNGYVVFVPDVVYKTGQPGQDAVDCIVSGTKKLMKEPWVNADKIGIQGQSWGGYQVAYLVTATNLYACGMAGAPVSNMTSAYGGIRWGSGMSREFQYERTQSRLGATLWEDREAYIKNSPVFFADKVNTPLLIMHNDEDGAVPWYQGIEYFMALRRLGKPAWMLTYNGEDHNLMKRHNRKDLSVRMMQFFDYYLRDAPAPEWMVNGRKAIEKDENPALELIAE